MVPITSKAVLVAVATNVPGLQNITTRWTGGGGTSSARYCYSVWLRHLSTLHQSGLPTRFGTIVEIGPGDTLGLGIAALLSCADRYIALDSVRYAQVDRNLAVFDELVDLFKDRTAIPDDAEFPVVNPRLSSYAFPTDVLPTDHLSRMLDPKRQAAIRDTLHDTIKDTGHSSASTGLLSYVAPFEKDSIEDQVADLVISQAVLQLVTDLPGIYREMDRWLKPDGIVSHQIDFKSYGITKEWNGHWACSDWLWQALTNKRRGQPNREPHSAHLSILTSLGYDIACDQRLVSASHLSRSQLAPRFAHLSDTDLTTSGALIQAQKPG
ncbi:methyltransferase domain-containing protein [Microvirga massiliensis]|uniref:methyltransferase domain-containing protein n=1 Tax=Microvirga massiliensis TaxID=1033741 RepID=UPI00062BAD9F|nr:methyltransferase domain-containing protein [Microvirga massiliensis]